MKLVPFFRWFDLWVGAYVDVPNRAVYVCPVPMFGLKIQLRPKPPRPFRRGERATWLETDEEITIEHVDEQGRVWVQFDDSTQRGWIDPRELRHA